MIKQSDYNNGKFSDLALIRRLFPDTFPKVEPLPSTDEIVCEYLRQHDVNVRPVSSNTGPSRVTNAAMGAMGAGYMAVNTHLTVQKKAAALQEWTSWKQWALSQPDFKDFKNRIIENYNNGVEHQDYWIAQNRAEVEQALAEHQDKESKLRRSAFKYLAIGICGWAVVLGLTKAVEQFRQPSPVPAITESRN